MTETQLKIKSLGHRGDGVADGPIYVPGALPGETVTGELDGDALRGVKIAVPSEDRVKPPCAHYKSCGGCGLQHASDTLVEEWKAGVVRRALAAQDIDADVLPVITSPAQSRRRATFAARRTKKAAMAGFHGRASDTIVDIPNCVLIDPALRAGLSVASELAEIGCSRKTTMDVAMTVTEFGLDVAATGGKEMDTALHQELARLSDARDLARLAWNGEIVLQRMPPRVAFDGIGVELPPAGFLQATAHAQHTLQQLISDAVAGAAHVVDLFAGCGTFALPLAKHAMVHAVEDNADAIAALDKGWRNAVGLKRVTHEVRDLFRRPLLPDELRFDAAVIDPPRAGATAQIAELAKSDIPTIAHVSCNPQTFARDAKILLGAGYQLGSVQPIDQIRWSPHIELFAVFTK